MDIQKQREAFEAWWEDFHNGRQIACDYVEEDNSYAVGYANAQWVAWQAAKAQKVAVQQIKQDLLDRVNARWELAHQQCVENWNTYSSAQMDAFDYIEQDINEILCENIIKEQEK